jgi:FAD binding domain
MDIERPLLRLKEVVGDLRGSEPVPSILGDLDGFEPIHFAPIEEIATDRWDHGRVVLIGDAAHATSPNMAEGASMALEDVLVLAHMLPRTARRPRPCWRSVDGGVLVSVGCGAERIAEIAYGVCPDPFATWRFVVSARSSIGETIDRCSKSHDQGEMMSSPANDGYDSTVENLILDLVEWVGLKGRSYQDTMYAWRTSCPRLPVWEEATERGFVETASAIGPLAGSSNA